MNAATDLCLEFLGFLRSFKNAESLSPQLRKAIAARTTLQDIVLESLSGGRVVLVTGSAGSGKTHLLRAIEADLEGKTEVLSEPSSIRRPHILIVEDATPLSPEDRVRWITAEGKHRVATLVAINEGPLREAARMPGGELLQFGVDLLHEAQRGISKGFEPNRPTVVDMGAFDPLEDEVLERILGLDLLRSAIEEVAPDPDSPRRRAWTQISNPTVRKRIAGVAKLARLAQPEWLFRDIWDFVADIALGGSDVEDPPTSVWFWRLFHGESNLSRALGEVADASSYPLPRIDGRLYYGDWNSVSNALLPDVPFVQISRPDKDPKRMNWLKCQAAVIAKDFRLINQVLRGGRGRSYEAALAGDVAAILRRINDYVSFGLREPAETRLDLWVEHAVERRTERLEGLIRVGQVGAEQFKILRSQVVVNHPDLAEIQSGHHAFLVHIPSLASFSLDRARLRTLETARSLRASDRLHVDLDWDLQRFFDRILSKNSWHEEFEIFSFRFGTGYSITKKFHVSRAARLVEEV